MFIVWSGLGILIPITATVGALIAGSLVTSLFGATGLPPWLPIAAGCLGAALACYGTAIWLDGLERKSERTYLDAATGQAVVFRRRHTVFFLRARVWSYILAGAAVALAVANLAGLTAARL